MRGLHVKVGARFCKQKPGNKRKAGRDGGDGCDDTDIAKNGYYRRRVFWHRAIGCHYRLAQAPIEIILFEKTGRFALGEAYKTPYFFHLLNVRAKDMSAFEDEPNHFVQWLTAHPDIKKYADPAYPLAEQFMPRKLYGQYLNDILKQSQRNHVQVRLETAEAVDVIPDLKTNQFAIVLQDGRQCVVDQVVWRWAIRRLLIFPFR